MEKFGQWIASMENTREVIKLHYPFDDFESRPLRRGRESCLVREW